MNVTAYIDESGTHGSNNLAMAAVVSDCGGWQRYGQEFSALLTEFGVLTFHAQDWKHSRGQFKRMSPDRRAMFVDRFSALINRTVEMGCCTILRLDEFETHYLAPMKSAGKQPESAYVACFRATLSTITQWVLARESSQATTIDVVIERGHKNIGGVERAFGAIKELLEPQFPNLIGRLMVGGRTDYPELCAADSFASFAWGLEEGQSPRLRLKGPSEADTTYRSNFYRVELGIESLRSLAEIAPAPRRRRVGPERLKAR